MSDKIQVILLEDIPALGQAGDIVSVVEGYARNLLFPRGLAALATQQAQAARAKRLSRKSAEKEAELEQLRQLALQLERTELSLTARRKDGDQIFGRITPAAIAKELQRAAHLQLKPKDILLNRPVDTFGTYDATLRLSPDVEAVIKVVVNPAPGEEQPGAADNDEA